MENIFKEQPKELAENGYYDPHDDQDHVVKLCYIEELGNISYKMCTSSALTLLRLGRPN